MEENNVQSQKKLIFLEGDQTIMSQMLEMYKLIPTIKIGVVDEDSNPENKTEEHAKTPDSEMENKILQEYMKYIIEYDIRVVFIKVPAMTEFSRKILIRLAEAMSMEIIQLTAKNLLLPNVVAEETKAPEPEIQPQLTIPEIKPQEEIVPEPPKKKPWFKTIFD